MNWKHTSKTTVWSSGKFDEGFYCVIRHIYPPSGPQVPQYELCIYLTKATVRRTVYSEVVGTLGTAKSHAEIAVRVLEWRS